GHAEAPACSLAIRRGHYDRVSSLLSVATARCDSSVDWDRARRTQTDIQTIAAYSCPCVRASISGDLCDRLRLLCCRSLLVDRAEDTGEQRVVARRRLASRQIAAGSLVLARR